MFAGSRSRSSLKSAAVQFTVQSAREEWSAEGLPGAGDHPHCLLTLVPGLTHRSVTIFVVPVHQPASLQLTAVLPGLKGGLRFWLLAQCLAAAECTVPACMQVSAQEPLGQPAATDNQHHENDHDT